MGATKAATRPRISVACAGSADSSSSSASRLSGHAPDYPSAVASGTSRPSRRSPGVPSGRSRSAQPNHLAAVAGTRAEAARPASVSTAMAASSAGVAERTEVHELREVEIP